LNRSERLSDIQNNDRNYFRGIPELEVRFQKLCQKIKERQPLIYSLKGKNGEFLFFESGAVTGSVRLLVFPEEIVLLTLPGYD
jgi:hypothetical protein